MRPLLQPGIAFVLVAINLVALLFEFHERSRIGAKPWIDALVYQWSLRPVAPVPMPGQDPADFAVACGTVFLGFEPPWPAPAAPPAGGWLPVDVTIDVMISEEDR